MAAQTQTASLPSPWNLRRLARLAALAPHYAILLFSALVSLLPLAWLISEACKPHNEALSFPISFIPSRFALFDNIQTVLARVPLLQYFMLSLSIVLVLAFTDILISSLTGFALAKYNFPGKKIVFYFILSTTMITMIVVIVPMYILVRRLGWVDTFLGLVAPSVVSAFGCFFMNTYISQIPSEYMDAARIDGCSEPGIFARIILPMCKPAIVTLAVFRFLWEWDNLFWPLIITGKESLRTLPLGLTIFMQQLGWIPGMSQTHLLVASLLVTLPVLFVFLILQKQFMSAMTGTGLKL
jgi:ABC-type glycerol-3-phosphate transport system permease component